MDNYSVLIVNHNGEDVLQLCIQQIRKFYPFIKIRVIDDNSNDNSEEICKNLNIEFYKNTLNWKEKYPFYGEQLGNYDLEVVVQEGLSHTYEDYVFVLDADLLIINEGIIELYISKIKDNIAIVGEYSNCDLRGPIAPRISTWAYLLNYKLLKDKGMTFAVSENEKNKYDYYKKIRRSRLGDQCSFFFFRLSEYGLEHYDILNEIKCHKIIHDVSPIEITNYFFHLSNYTKQKPHSLLNWENKAILMYLSINDPRLFFYFLNKLNIPYFLSIN